MFRKNYYNNSIFSIEKIFCVIFKNGFKIYVPLVNFTSWKNLVEKLDFSPHYFEVISQPQVWLHRMQISKISKIWPIPGIQHTYVFTAN